MEGLPAETEPEPDEQVEQLAGNRAGAGHHREALRGETRVVEEVAQRVADGQERGAQQHGVDAEPDRDELREAAVR